MRGLREVDAGTIAQPIQLGTVVTHDDTQHAAQQHSGVIAGIARDQHVFWGKAPFPEQVPHGHIAPSAHWDNIQKHAERHNNFSTHAGLAEDFLDRGGIGT